MDEKPGASRVWFTSDTHLGHRNIIEYCSRPFLRDDGQPDVDLMDRRLGELWDASVRSGDRVYVLGDISMDPARAREWLSRRPGQKFLVWGNHDPRPKDRKGRELLSGVFVRTADIMDIDVEGQRIVLCHFPMLVWNRAHFGSWMLHGHTHGGLVYPDQDMRIADVGVDVWGYAPVSFEQLRAAMDGRPVRNHHYFKERGE